MMELEDFLSDSLLEWCVAEGERDDSELDSFMASSFLGCVGCARPKRGMQASPVVLRTPLGSSSTSSTTGILNAFLLNRYTPVVRNPEAIYITSGHCFTSCFCKDLCKIIPIDFLVKIHT